jgi:hypothetical protein
VKTRDNQLVAGFLSDGFTFKGTHYKPLTAQTLLILEKVKSPFFTGEDLGVRGLLDFLFVSSRSAADVLSLTRDADAWELAVLEFAAGLTSQDLEALGHLVAESNENVAAAVVEASGECSGKKPATSRTGARR